MQNDFEMRVSQLNLMKIYKGGGEIQLKHFEKYNYEILMVCFRFLSIINELIWAH